MPAKLEIACALAILASAAVADGGALEVHSPLAGGEAWPVVPLDGKVRELADKTVYYLTNNVTIVGRDSTSPNSPGESALAVKPGATAYICIPKGLTLSCTGGNGCKASDGAGRRAPNAKVKKATIYGVTINTATFEVAQAGGGGAGASGGGAGIHVPSDSTLAVFGGGTLTAAGGKGGAAGAGGSGNDCGLYIAASWCGEEDKDINAVEHKVHKTNIPNFGPPGWEGKSSDGYSCIEMNAQPTSGGGGGGGAGGGGAAIGTPGSAGHAGYAGGAHAPDELWPKHYNSNPDDCYIACAQGKSGQERTAATDCGTVYLDVTVTNLRGGLGGSSRGGSSGAVTNNYSFSIWDGEFGDERESEQWLYFVEGGAGGSGGAGGVGMSGVGRGGTGGAGGAGGAAGSVTCKLTTFIKPVNRRQDLTPAHGGTGANGEDGSKSDKSRKLVEEEYPYNTVECLAGTEASRYRLSCGDGVTLAMTGADYAGGWSLTKDGAARTLPGLVNDSTAFLTSGPSIYAPGGSVTVGTATCGDVKLGLRNLRVTTGDGSRADIRIRKDSDYYKRYLEPRGTDLAGMEKWLDDPWCEGARNWMGYVLGVGLTNRIALAIGPAANSNMLEICALAVPTNGAKGVWEEIHPPADSWFRPSFRFCTTNDLKAARSAWPCVCERTGLEGQGVRMEVDPASTDFRQFYRLRVDAVPATEERGD